MLGLGDPAPEDLKSQRDLIYRLINNYTSGVDGMISGEYQYLPQFFQDKLAENHLFGAAKIQEIFATYSKKVLDLDANSKITDARVENVCIILFLCCIWWLLSADILATNNLDKNRHSLKFRNNVVQIRPYLDHCLWVSDAVSMGY